MKEKILIFIIIALIGFLSLITVSYICLDYNTDISSSTNPDYTVTADTNIDTNINTDKKNLNNEDNWIVSISPIYLDSPANTVYIYQDSYVITNSYWFNESDRIHKTGKLTSNFPQSLLSTIKNDESTDADSWSWYKVTLQSGDVTYLKKNSKFISEIEKLINYDGTIWYARHDN